jgi:superfamily II DNA or RNA helicase
MAIQNSFKIGDIVTARDRLWRIDQIQSDEKNKDFYFYSVSSITGQQVSEVLFPSIEPIEEAKIPFPVNNKIGSPIYQKLLLNALRLDLIYGTSSFISLQNSKVIPVSYQLVPVLMALNLPKVRLLLADDVGLGKTIEAGLILQELLGRKRINRVLFITPANLREQWQGTLREIFGIDAVIMSRTNRKFLESELLVGGSPWGYYNFVITSMDYAKRIGVREEIMQFPWDMLVIDEAHNVMKPHLGTENEEADEFKMSYGFAKKMTEMIPHVLLLTATPHNGYKDSFASILDMVNPSIVKRINDRIEIERTLALNHICQRRRKDVEQWIKPSSFGKKPFPERDSDEIYSQPSEQFLKAMEILNKFFFKVLKQAEKSPVGERKLSYWTVLHFHKRLISSPAALVCSVQNRLEEIERKIAKQYQAIQNTENFLSAQEAGQAVMDGNETDRLSEEELDGRTDKYILSKSLEDLNEEKKLLKDVEATSRKLMDNDADHKLKKLLDEILPTMFKNSKKIILFTRYIDTLYYLKEKFEEKNKTTVKYRDLDLYEIHGEMPTQKRQENYAAFLKSNKMKLLLSTDCMSEGIDLQFSANQIINYELTWNPNRLEQRNGRVDRFGQPEEKVFIRTIIMENTLEMDILELLVKKARDIKEEYGFVPGFFGDPEKVIDHLMAKRKKEKKAQTTLDQFVQFSPQIMEDLVSLFFSKKNVEDMVKDSFYGHNNVNLSEVEERMKLTENEIGNSKTLLEFLKIAVDLYGGKITPTPDNAEIYELTLPESIQKELDFEFGSRYLITPNMELSNIRKDAIGLTLKNPIVAGLVEKVKNEAFAEDTPFYGRTGAYASQEVDKVSAIYFLKIRYLVMTEPKTLMEEIVPFGLDLLSKDALPNEKVLKIWESPRLNHGNSEDRLLKHLQLALTIPELETKFHAVGEHALEKLIADRKNMIARLSTQGVATDLLGIDKIEIAGVDLLTISLIYPSSKK